MGENGYPTTAETFHKGRQGLHQWNCKRVQRCNLGVLVPARERTQSCSARNAPTAH